MILIVEDQADLRQLVKLQLQNHGFSCFDVPGGHDVVPALKSNSIDLVLMDINMPKMDI